MLKIRFGENRSFSSLYSRTSYKNQKVRYVWTIGVNKRSNLRLKVFEEMRMTAFKLYLTVE